MMYCGSQVEQECAERVSQLSSPLEVDAFLTSVCTVARQRVSPTALEQFTNMSSDRHDCDGSSSKFSKLLEEEIVKKNP